MSAMGPTCVKTRSVIWFLQLMRGHGMKRFIEGADRRQSTLFPERFEDYIDDDNPVRAIDVFVDSLDLGLLGFNSVVPEATGRPGYHPATLPKIYIYGYLNQVQSSRRLEREWWPPGCRLRRSTACHRS